MKKILLSFFVLVMAVPAFAFNVPLFSKDAKLDIYGQVLMSVFSENTNVAQGPLDNRENGGGSDFRMQWQSDSRLGFNFSTDKFFAVVEMKVTPDRIGEAGFRQFFGGYKFDNGLTMTIGNQWTTGGTGRYFNDIYFEDNCMGSFGVIYDERHPSIMLNYSNFTFAIITNEYIHNDGGPFPIKRFIQDKNGNYVRQGAGAKDDVTRGEHYMPRFELAYNINVANITGHIFTGYGYFTEKVENDANTNANGYYNFHAFHVGFGIVPHFGDFYTTISAFYALNAGIYSAIQTINNDGTSTKKLKPSVSRSMDSDQYDRNDIRTWGVAVGFGYKINNFVSAELAAGYESSSSDGFRKLDDPKDTDTIDSFGVYLNAPIKFNPHLVLTPQVAYYARSTDSAYQDDDGGLITSVSALLAGVQLKVLF